MLSQLLCKEKNGYDLSTNFKWKYKEEPGPRLFNQFQVEQVQGATGRRSIKTVVQGEPGLNFHGEAQTYEARKRYHPPSIATAELKSLDDWPL